MKLNRFGEPVHQTGPTDPLNARKGRGQKRALRRKPGSKQAPVLWPTSPPK